MVGWTYSFFFCNPSSHVNFIYVCVDLISVFETAITQRKQMEQDESKIKKELLKAFLERLEQKNKDVKWQSLEHTHMGARDLTHTHIK